MEFYKWLDRWKRRNRYISSLVSFIGNCHRFPCRYGIVGIKKKAKPARQMTVGKNKSFHWVLWYLYAVILI